jgi:hypothetical protein
LAAALLSRRSRADVLSFENRALDILLCRREREKATQQLVHFRVARRIPRGERAAAQHEELPNSLNNRRPVKERTLLFSILMKNSCSPSSILL